MLNNNTVVCNAYMRHACSIHDLGLPEIERQWAQLQIFDTKPVLLISFNLELRRTKPSHNIVRVLANIRAEYLYVSLLCVEISELADTCSALLVG